MRDRTNAAKALLRSHKGLSLSVKSLLRQTEPEICQPITSECRLRIITCGQTASRNVVNDRTGLILPDEIAIHSNSFCADEDNFRRRSRSF